MGKYDDFIRDLADELEFRSDMRKLSDLLFAFKLKRKREKQINKQIEKENKVYGSYAKTQLSHIYL